MDIVVTGRKMSVGDELKSYVETQLSNATKVFKIDPMTAEVVLRRDNKPNRRSPSSCEITLRTKGHIIRTESTDDDVHAAIDIATAKLARQLRKFKTKVIDRRHSAVKLADVLAAPEPDTAVENELVAEVELDEEEKLVRIKEIDLDVLDIEAALLQMDLLGHDFFVFISAEDGLTCVLYRRKAGGYGLLRPSLEKPDTDV